MSQVSLGSITSLFRPALWSFVALSIWFSDSARAQSLEKSARKSSRQQASETTSKDDLKLIFYVNPVLISGDGLNLGIDLGLGGAASVGVYGSGSFSESESFSGTSKSRSVGFGVRGDWNFSGRAFTNGWYISPFVSRYTFGSETRLEFQGASSGSPGSTQNQASSSSLIESELVATNVGSTFGYVFASEEDGPFNLFVRVGLGAMYTSVGGELKSDEREVSTEILSADRVTSGVLPTGDIHVGIIF